ncbi:MAG: hypothetical protein LUD12_10200 [Lachnospiraceae bacterium]|nr:hypothetical protein [Lachnospiraceae bacterium]
MDYIIIEVPDMNDSISRITLDDVDYQIRFTYNDTQDYWSFGLYDDQGDPIAIGIKIVPRAPLNLFFGVNELPDGVFGVLSNLDRIGHDDFKDGNAKFIYAPVDMGDEESE